MSYPVFQVRIELCKLLGVDPASATSVVLKIRTGPRHIVEVNDGVQKIDYLLNAENDDFSALYRTLGIDPDVVTEATLRIDVNDVPELRVTRRFVNLWTPVNKPKYVLEPQTVPSQEIEVTTLADETRRYALRLRTETRGAS